jgi:hypothetical protein
VPDWGRTAKAIVATTAVALATYGAVLVGSPACTTHDCDPSTSTFDLGTHLMSFDGGSGQGASYDAGSGQILLESSAWDGTWLNYPGNITITVVYPENFTPDPDAPTIWVSTAQPQEDSGATSTPAAGQLAQITNVSPTGFELNNGSCADYYVWFSVTGTMDAHTTNARSRDSGSDGSRD